MGDAERAERAAEQASQAFARRIGNIARDARQTRSQGMAIPELEADPVADDPTTAWVLADGRLCWRTSDGTVHRVYPEAQRVYPILSLNANPAASTGIDYFRHDPSDEFRVRRPDGTWARYAAIAPATGGEGGGNSGGGSSSTKPKPAQTKVVKRTRDYGATWGRTLCPVHGAETGGDLSYGRWSSTHGQRRIMLGFNDSQIRADLAGSTPREAYLSMNSTHAYANAGGEVRFGGHKQTSPPAAYSSVRERVFADHWPKVGYGKTWRRVPLWFAVALRDDVIRGLTINQMSDAIGYYGAMEWASATLRFVYTVEV